MKNILGWILGVFCALIGAVGLIDAISNPSVYDYVMSFMFLLISACILPPVSAFIEGKLQLSKGKYFGRRWRLKVIAVCFVIVVFVIPGAKQGDAQPEKAIPLGHPKLRLLSSEEDQGNAKEYLLEFTASDADMVLVNEEEIKPQDGKYAKVIPLKDLATRLHIVAKDAELSYIKDELNLTIKRSETEEEKQARIDRENKERQRMKADQAAAVKKGQEAEAAWKSSKAGRLCQKHPEWSKSDCSNVAENKIWIGMTYDMLVAMWGNPSSASPSNFGSGTEWQWCWWNYTPSCFYDHNEDGKVDAYN